VSQSEIGAAEIQKLLEKATPGPWIVVREKEGHAHSADVIIREAGTTSPGNWIATTSWGEIDEDALLIAAAPDIARFALAQAAANAELRAEVARLRLQQDERSILIWMAGSDSGASSESLANCHLGIPRRWGWSEPIDDSDFGRCYRLLLRFPEIRPCVDSLAGQHSGWAKLAPIWDELMTMAREDGLDKRGKWSERIDARIRAARWPDRAALAAAQAGERA
jgi:hypothetical protein